MDEVLLLFVVGVVHCLPIITHDLFILQPTMRLLLSLLLLVGLPRTAVEGVCMLDQPIREQFDLSSYVARLNYTGDKTDLACRLRVYNTVSGTNELVDSLSSYQVVEVFKGDDLIERDTIPLFLTTDTGFVPDIDPKFNSATEGFLVFLFPWRRCYDELGGPYMYFDDFEPTPFSTSNCVSANTVWSEVSEADQSFLRSGGTLEESSVPSKAPTKAPTALVTRAPSTPAPVIPGTIISGAPPATPMPVIQPTPVPTRCWDACSAGTGKQWVCKRDFGCEGCISDLVCPLLCFRCADETTPFAGLDCDCSA